MVLDGFIMGIFFPLALPNLSVSVWREVYITIRPSPRNVRLDGIIRVEMSENKKIFNWV